jgi:pimeloyl-ACP methyl ester carboxylesterase
MKVLFSLKAWALVSMLLFLGLSKITVDQVAKLDDICDLNFKKNNNHPGRFYHYLSDQSLVPIDLSRWWTSGARDINFYSLDNKTRLNAWIIERGQAWVILVHGHSHCKKDAHILANAGMLAKQGFSVLLLDLREHGNSQRYQHKHSAGYYESDDILAARHWIMQHKHIPTHKIGLYGTSFGSGVSSVAFSKEPGIPALWLDAPYADMAMITKNELNHRGLPMILGHLARFGGMWSRGIDLFALSPLDSTRHIGSRAMVISYYTRDKRTPKIHGEMLCKSAKAHAENPEKVSCVEINQGLPTPSGKIEYHSVGPFVDKAWEKRLVGFFTQHLGDPKIKKNPQSASTATSQGKTTLTSQKP